MTIQMGQARSVNVSVLGSGSNSAFNNTSIPDLLSDYYRSDKVNPYVTKQQIYKLNEDILVLAAAWHRFRTLRNLGDSSTRGVLIESMISPSLFEFTNDADRKLASEIREFYSKKFMMLKLKGVSFTKYREDLNELIHGSGDTVKDSDFGLAYYLPDFYNYDTEFELIQREHNKEVNAKNGVSIKNLKLVKVFKIQRKRIRRIECWFSDEEKNLVKMNTEITNPLISLLEKNAKEFIPVEGVYVTRRRDDYHYYELSNSKFI